MKKTLMVMGVVIVLATVLAAVGYAYAQTQKPPDFSTDSGDSWIAGDTQDVSSLEDRLVGDANDAPYSPRGVNSSKGPDWDNSTKAEIYAPRASGRVVGGNSIPDLDEASGPLADYMLDAYAEVFGLDPGELTARLNIGNSLWDIASEQGLSAQEYKTRLELAHMIAINQALENGTITQEQADWMLAGDSSPSQPDCNPNQMGEQGESSCLEDYDPGNGLGEHSGDGGELEDNQP